MKKHLQKCSRKKPPAECSRECPRRIRSVKAGKGWSDAELYEHYCYNLQVRYALGYDKLGEGDFEFGHYIIFVNG